MVWNLYHDEGIMKTQIGQICLLSKFFVVHVYIRLKGAAQSYGRLRRPSRRGEDITSDVMLFLERRRIPDFMQVRNKHTLILASIALFSNKTRQPLRLHPLFIVHTPHIRGTAG